MARIYHWKVFHFFVFPFLVGLLKFLLLCSGFQDELWVVRLLQLVFSFHSAVCSVIALRNCAKRRALIHWNSSYIAVYIGNMVI